MLFAVAFFVAYSQFVSVGLTGLYRYSPLEPTFNDGASPEVYAGMTIWESSWTVETIVGFADWYTPYRPVRDAIIGLILAVAGSSGLIALTYVRKQQRHATLILLISSVLGIATPLLIKAYEWILGSLYLSWHSTTATDGPLARHAIHPIYGLVELLGGLVMPVVVYGAMIIAIVLLVLLRAIQRLRAHFSRSSPSVR